jgi:hypothetical protein
MGGAFFLQANNTADLGAADIKSDKNVFLTLGCHVASCLPYN